MKHLKSVRATCKGIAIAHDTRTRISRALCNHTDAVTERFLYLKLRGGVVSRWVSDIGLSPRPFAVRCVALVIDRTIVRTQPALVE